MTKVQNFSQFSNENNDNFQNKSLEINDLENEFVNENDKPIFQKVLNMEKNLLENSASEVLSPTPIFTRFDPKTGQDVTIIQQGTINILQGKTGTFKSSISEYFVSILLANANAKNTLGFRVTADCAVSYIDTERSVKDEFPLAIQRMREKAGFPKTYNVPNFFPMSIARAEREERVEYSKACLQIVRERTDKPIFAVLDVVTDCVSSFNNEKETMKLFDELRNFCDEFGATFLLVIHENPSSEKARGHTGTEGQNKASTVMQISLNSDDEDNELVKLKFLKMRNAHRIDSIYMCYSNVEKGLVLADDESVKREIEKQKKGLDLKCIVDFLEKILKDDAKEVSVIYTELSNEFNRDKRVFQNHIAEIIRQKYILYDQKGQPCTLDRVQGEQDKRKTFFTLVPLKTLEK